MAPLYRVKNLLNVNKGSNCCTLSRISDLLVEARTITPSLVCIPSISASSWFRVRSWSCCALDSFLCSKKYVNFILELLCSVIIKFRRDAFAQNKFVFARTYIRTAVFFAHLRSYTCSNFTGIQFRARNWIPVKFEHVKIAFTCKKYGLWLLNLREIQWYHSNLYFLYQM